MHRAFTSKHELLAHLHSLLGRRVNFFLGTAQMTFTLEHDLAEHPAGSCSYADGAQDVIAIPMCTLQQGPGWGTIARIIAHEWMVDGFIRQGTIVRVRPLPPKSLT
jgi:hypothetical protein